MSLKNQQHTNTPKNLEDLQASRLPDFLAHLLVWRNAWRGTIILLCFSRYQHSLYQKAHLSRMRRLGKSGWGLQVPFHWTCPLCRGQWTPGAMGLFSTYCSRAGHCPYLSLFCSPCYLHCVTVFYTLLFICFPCVHCQCSYCPLIQIFLPHILKTKQFKILKSCWAYRQR